MFVVPAARVDTSPDAVTEATAGFELLHVPPRLPLLLYCAVVLGQSGEAPLTEPALTRAFTVSVFDALDVLQGPVTV